MKTFWPISTNVGDTLTPVILQHFTKHKAERVSSLERDKLLLCGSILEFAQLGDTVLGAGHYKREPVDLRGVTIRALRGRLSGEAPAYGDPAILLPLMYKPHVKKRKSVGYIPHLWDHKNYDDFIDVNLPWKKFVREVLACDSVVASSLHGFIIAQAYGVPATWVQSPNVPGCHFKYRDYLSGVEDGIEHAQQDLLKALRML